MSYKLGGKYYEDLNLGDEFITCGRVITDADIMLFGTFTGDWHPLHFNEDYAKKGPFGKRIAHGFLSLTISVGMIQRMGWWDGTVLAFLGLDNVKLTAPVFIGDTIYAKSIIKEKRETKSPDRGIVTQTVRIMNQDDKEVGNFDMTFMWARRKS